MIRRLASFRTDRYLDALALGADRGASDVPAASELDPAIRTAALRLRDELVRVHPSFRFEERLAARLADAAAAMPEPQVAAITRLAMPETDRALAGAAAGNGAAAGTPSRLPGPIAWLARSHRIGILALSIVTSALVSLGAAWLVRNRGSQEAAGVVGAAGAVGVHGEPA